MIYDLLKIQAGSGDVIQGGQLYMTCSTPLSSLHCTASERHSNCHKPPAARIAFSEHGIIKWDSRFVDLSQNVGMGNFGIDHVKT
jgi:hypothetical protein